MPVFADRYFEPFANRFKIFITWARPCNEHGTTGKNKYKNKWPSATEKNICVLIAKRLINKSKIKITLATHASSLVNYRKIIKLCRWFVAMPVKCPNILRFPLKKQNSRFTMVVMCTWYKVPNWRKLLFNLYRKLHGARSINEKSHACLAKYL
jgi:hypothetical protein